MGTAPALGRESQGRPEGIPTQDGTAGEENFAIPEDNTALNEGNQMVDHQMPTDGAQLDATDVASAGDKEVNNEEPAQ